MVIKLILEKTNYDGFSTWTEIKTVDVELPLAAQDGWNVIGADWEYDTIYNKRKEERVETNRLINSLEQEIDQLTGNSRLQRREASEGLEI